MIIAVGNYKGKAVKGSIQIGESETGTLQMALDMDVKGSDGVSLGTMTTFMFFSEKAAVYTWERLALLGWKGKGADDLTSEMEGIDTNEVDVRVTAAESYKAPDGTMKMGSSKLEIVTGSGKVTLAKPLDINTFRARLKATGTAPASGTSKPAAGGGGAPF